MRISGQSILASVRPEALQKGMDPATFQGVINQRQKLFTISDVWRPDERARPRPPPQEARKEPCRPDRPRPPADDPS